jgi:MFS transporter, SHS family, lactate transporter
MAAAESVTNIPWWRAPTREQWLTWWAAWLGWTLSAFDFTVFLLIIAPIAREFGVSLAAVGAVFTPTLWLQLVGAIGSGWLADRIGRRTLLMISVLWYSISNLIAGFSPTFWFLLLFRSLLGIGTGAVWPASAVLAMEAWPARSRGFMSGVLQGSWSLGVLLSSLIYGLFYHYIGWRGMLWIGILPALLVVYIRFYVKESGIWVENCHRQRIENREVRAPLISIFKPGMLANTVSVCWWTGSSYVVYYSIWGLSTVHLQKDLHLSPGLIALPILLANLTTFFGMGFWGWTADRLGRRWAMIIPAAIAIPVAPLYLFTADYAWLTLGFAVQGAFGGALASQFPSYLSERFPTEVRATASAFCSQQAGFLGSLLVAPELTSLATSYDLSLATAMLVGTCVGVVSLVTALIFSPETKGKVLVPDLVVA